MEELGFPPRGATSLWSDSSSARQLVTDFRVGSKSQHLTMRINAINQEVNNGIIEVKYMDTDGNTVDVLTKALPVIPFERHADTLQHGFRNQPLVAKAKKIEKPISFKAKMKKVKAAKVRTLAHSN